MDTVVFRSIARMFVTISFALAARDAIAAEPSASACLMEPSLQMKLATSVPGVLDQVLVDRGDRVAKGMVVAQLESVVEAADVAAAEIRAGDESGIRDKTAHLEYAEAKRARLDRLRNTTQFVSPTAYEEAVADARQAVAAVQAATTALRLAQVDLEHARAKLGQRSIRSPIDGVVTERALGAGEYGYEQSHVLTVAALDPLYVEAFLPIASFGSVKVGATAEVRPEAPVGGVYTAVVDVVDAVLDSRSGTFGVRLRLANSGGVLPAGIRCTVSLHGQN